MNIQSFFSDSSIRAKFFAQYFAFFAVVYHVAFIVVFKLFGVMPMVYMNLYSVPYFILLAVITPRVKNYVFIYIISCLEVYTHQSLGVYTLGVESSFHFFFIPYALLPLYTFKERYGLAMLFSLLGGGLFFAITMNSGSFPPLYHLPPRVLFITKAVNIFLALAVILTSVFLYSYIAWYSERFLEKKIINKSREVRQRDKKVALLQEHTVNSLANLVENRDSGTGEHIQRTSALVELIARAAYERKIYPEVITESFIEKIKQASPMHDVGKIVITDVILKKPAQLTQEEYEDIKRHTVEGAKIVKEIIGVSDDPEFIRITEEVAMCHHERWDGNGYPCQLKGSEIPVSARIMAIADVYDALVSERCYKKAVSKKEALKVIKSESCKQFDPVLVELFLDVINDYEQ